MVLALVPRTEGTILKVLSLIIWTPLILIVTAQYAWLAMSLGKKGEGGTIVLRELLNPLLKSDRSKYAVLILTVIGVSLLMGDGVITPAISILSAVEGLPLIPGLERMGTEVLVLLATGIAVALFAFHRRGTERIAFAFGPIMVVWFATLTLSGLVLIARTPFAATAAFIALIGTSSVISYRDVPFLYALLNRLFFTGMLVVSAVFIWNAGRTVERFRVSEEHHRLWRRRLSTPSSSPRGTGSSTRIQQGNRCLQRIPGTSSSAMTSPAWSTRPSGSGFSAGSDRR